MTRKSAAFGALAVCALAVTYVGVSQYLMNASFSVADSSHQRYYTHYAGVWGIVAIIGILGLCACLVGAWRSRSR